MRRKAFVFGSFQLHAAVLGNSSDRFQVPAENVSAEHLPLAELPPTADTAVMEHIDEFIKLLPSDVYPHFSFQLHGGLLLSVNSISFYAAADDKSACAEIIGSQSVSADINVKTSRQKPHEYLVVLLYSLAVVDDKLVVSRYVHTRVEVQLLAGKL